MTPVDIVRITLWGAIAAMVAWLSLKVFIGLLDHLVLWRIPTTPKMAWLCWLVGHDDEDRVSDDVVPYRHRCLRCGRRHRLDGR